MNDSTIRQIISLNKQLYADTNTGKSFSSTRKYSWEGWGRLPSIIKRFKNNKLRNVLDLGCGNGRFYNELVINDKWSNILCDDFNYLGLDTDYKMLTEARRDYLGNNVTFKHHDVISNPDRIVEIYGKFDFVVAFGVSHHIPSEEFRKKWFRTIANVVEDEGVLCITTWQVSKSDQFKHAKRFVKTDRFNISESELEEFDYFLKWNNQELHRYCHEYSDREMNYINSVLRRCGIRLKSVFTADSKYHNLNKYYVYKKDGN